MGDSKSLISLGDLTKPANTLIEKISDAIGEVFKPYQIVRVAQAEARAETIRAATQIKVTELQRRAVRRFIMEEAKKQNNIETITGKALPYVDEQARPEEVEDDWIVDFFDKCRLISDEEMQNLWARILAGEANSPGKFSKRTIDLVASMDKSDASLFSNLCSFGVVWDRIYVLIYDVNAKMYVDHEINFTSLCHLDSIGLVHFENSKGYVRQYLPKRITLDYFGQQVYLEFPNIENNKFRVGKVILTKAGNDLAPICSAALQDGFVDYLRENWKRFGYTIEPQNEAPVSEHGTPASSGH